MTLYIRIHLVLLLSISLNALNASNLASFSELQAALKLKKEGPVLEYSSSTYEEVPNKFGTIVEPLLKLKPSKRQRSNAHIKLLNSILDGSWKKKEEKGHFKKLSEKEINTSTTRYKLTPLHAAAAMNDADAAKWLLKNGADINAQDHRGWTPRHFAALHETHDLLVDLEDYKPNKKLENKQGGTAYDNWYMTHPYDSKKFNVQVWSHKEKRVATRPATHIEKKTRKKFTPNIIISPVALLSLWSSSLDADNSSSKLKESLQTLRVKTPPEGYFPRGDLYFKDIGTPTGYITKTSEKFSREDVIDRITGELIFIETKGEVHGSEQEITLQQQLNDKNFINFGRLAATGFPNAAFILVKNANGFILEEDLVALNNINPHDGIFVADGSVDNRKGQFIEPNEPGLMAYEDWLLEDRESKIESFIENTRTPSEGLIDIRKAQGQYFFSTPTAILHLIARGEKYFDLAKFIMTHDALESVAYFASIKEKFLPLVKHLNESDLNFRAATQAFLREKLKKEGYLKKFYLFASDDAIEIMTNSCIIQAAEDETHIREILEDVWSSVSRTLCLKQADDPGVKIFCD